MRVVLHTEHFEIIYVFVARVAVLEHVRENCLKILDNLFARIWLICLEETTIR